VSGQNQPAGHTGGVHQAGRVTWPYVDPPARPRLLELFGGAHGSAVGYARAGFAVTSVDIVDHGSHPELENVFVADALAILDDIDYCLGFDLITAGPPCRDHTRLAALHGDTGTGWMLAATIQKLRRVGRPWVVENVADARPVRGELMLCGSMFGLGADCLDGRRRHLRRHRLFASSEFLWPPGHCRHRGEAVGVYGHGGSSPEQRGYSGVKAEAEQAMGIDWMRMADLVQAIPPAYTQWIGEQLIDRLSLTDAATRAAPARQEAV
jgi:DNA (cytosine-5)-methyltransferase 1